MFQSPPSKYDLYVFMEAWKLRLAIENLEGCLLFALACRALAGWFLLEPSLGGDTDVIKGGNSKSTRNDGFSRKITVIHM